MKLCDDEMNFQKLMCNNNIEHLCSFVHFVSFKAPVIYDGNENQSWGDYVFQKGQKPLKFVSSSLGFPSRVSSIGNL